jgi:hypothetical protein
MSEHDEQMYVAVYELRLYFREGPGTLGPERRQLPADGMAAWHAGDGSLIRDKVQEAHDDGDYPCDGVVVFPRRLVRLDLEDGVDVPLDAHEAVEPANRPRQAEEVA